MKKQCTIKFWNAGNIVANFMTLTIGFHNNVHQWSLKISETVDETLTFCVSTLSFEFITYITFTYLNNFKQKLPAGFDVASKLISGMICSGSHPMISNLKHFSADPIHRTSVEANILTNLEVTNVLKLWVWIMFTLSWRSSA